MNAGEPTMEDEFGAVLITLRGYLEQRPAR
jgi:hypothetical protein